MNPPIICSILVKGKCFLWTRISYLYNSRKYSSAWAYRSSCSIGVSMPIALKADFFHEVTMFHPIRPFVRWSRVENRLASKKGGSKEVEAVMPNARFLVTAAMAEMGCRNSQLGRVQYSSETPPSFATLFASAYNRWISHGPLRRPSDSLVYTAAI